MIIPFTSALHVFFYAHLFGDFVELLRPQQEPTWVPAELEAVIHHVQVVQLYVYIYVLYYRYIICTIVLMYIYNMYTIYIYSWMYNTVDV